MKKTHKRLLGISLAICLSVTSVCPAMASTLTKAKNEKAKAEQELNSVNDKIQDIQGQQSNLQKEINALDAELVTTIANISLIEEEIVVKEAELKQAEGDLEIAQEKEVEQYTSMKERISYMYVNGGEVSFFNALLGAHSFADALNRAQAFASVYQYDRKLLNEYQENERRIEELIVTIAEEQADMKEEERSLEDQKNALNHMVAQKSAEMDNFDEMLASAKSLANQYKNTIKEQQRLIAAEVEAQQRAQAQAQAQAQANANKTNTATLTTPTSKPSSSTASTVTKPAATNTNTNTNTKPNTNTSTGNTNSGNTNSNTSGSSSSTGTTSNAGYTKPPASTTGVSGSSVANYACNFVGNPYVWGGTSLTNGADCSGFVMSVYAHFGISLPHSSASLAYVGRPVAVADMQPGDIVCYSGHVAIYIGGGAIVHASNAKDGIKISPNYAYRTVVAIRRVV